MNGAFPDGGGRQHCLKDSFTLCPTRFSPFLHTCRRWSEVIFGFSFSKFKFPVIKTMRQVDKKADYYIYGAPLVLRRTPCVIFRWVQGLLCRSVLHIKFFINWEYHYTGEHLCTAGPSLSSFLWFVYYLSVAYLFWRFLLIFIYLFFFQAEGLVPFLPA